MAERNDGVFRPVQHEKRRFDSGEQILTPLVETARKCGLI
jgi:hypothetical protein